MPVLLPLLIGERIQTKSRYSAPLKQRIGGFLIAGWVNGIFLEHAVGRWSVGCVEPAELSPSLCVCDEIVCGAELAPIHVRLLTSHREGETGVVSPVFTFQIWFPGPREGHFLGCKTATRLGEDLHTLQKGREIIYMFSKVSALRKRRSGPIVRKKSV